MLDPLLESQLRAVISSPEGIQANINAREQFLERISLHSRAYDAGYISRERLIDVVVEPFFLLSEKVSKANHEQPSGFPGSVVSSQKETRDRMLAIWGEALIRALSEASVADRHDVARCSLEMSPRNRAKLVKALSKANFFQVKHQTCSRTLANARHLNSNLAGPAYRSAMWLSLDECGTHKATGVCSSCQICTRITQICARIIAATKKSS